MAAGADGVDESCVFVRIMWCDAAGVRRCRVVPRRRLEEVLRTGVGLAFACMFLPSWGDSAPPSISPVGEARLKPDMSTLRMLPWNPTHAVVLATMCADGRMLPWECCPRTALASALRLLQGEGGLRVQAGFEVEFTLLQQPSGLPGSALSCGLPVDSSVYCQTSAYDAASPVLDEICAAVEALGDSVEQVHAESAGGQFEIATRYREALAAADALLLRKEAISCVARRHGLVASMLPKLHHSQAGSGCHCHFSLCSAMPGQDAMADAARPHGLSRLAEWFGAGILSHLDSLIVFTAGSPNSYRRIAPSTWSGAYRCWGVNNREAPLRLVGSSAQHGTLNFELKCFDATANPHIGLVAMVAAGVLGIRGRLELPAPVSVDPGTLSEKERAELGIARLPTTLEAAVHAAEADTALLGVMREAIGGADLVRAYLAVKRSEWGYFNGMELEQEAALLHARF